MGPGDMSPVPEKQKKKEEEHPGDECLLGPPHHSRHQGWGRDPPCKQMLMAVSLWAHRNHHQQCRRGLKRIEPIVNKVTLSPCISDLYSVRTVPIVNKVTLRYS